MFCTAAFLTWFFDTRHTICIYLDYVLTARVWSVFQGGPGIRGARGDRGEPGVTVSEMYLNSERSST